MVELIFMNDWKKNMIIESPIQQKKVLKAQTIYNFCSEFIFKEKKENKY